MELKPCPFCGGKAILNHDHAGLGASYIRCEKCGRVFDVDMAYITGLEKNITDTHGFTFTGYDILFRGICPECQDKK